MVDISTPLPIYLVGSPLKHKSTFDKQLTFGNTPKLKIREAKRKNGHFAKNKMPTV